MLKNDCLSRCRMPYDKWQTHELEKEVIIHVGNSALTNFWQIYELVPVFMVKYRGNNADADDVKMIEESCWWCWWCWWWWWFWWWCDNDEDVMIMYFIVIIITSSSTRHYHHRHHSFSPLVISWTYCSCCSFIIIMIIIIILSHDS